MTIRNVFFTGSIPKVLQVNRKYRVLRNQCKKGKNIDNKATTSPLLSFHKVWHSSKTQILLVSTQIKNFFFNSSNIELCICRCMKQYKVNFQYLMTKRLCKTYMKIKPKYIQVPPILNFLYGSFSTAWVIYFTARIISTFISISTFPKKIVLSCKLNYLHSCYFHHWVRQPSMACSPVGLISLMVKRLHPINRIGQDSIPDQASIFSGTCSTLR